MGITRETFVNMLPRWKCHKIVRAVKIKAIQQNVMGPGAFIDAEGPITNFAVDQAYLLKHNPQPGGYFVVYEDGYESFSPAEAFEAGYTQINLTAPPDPAASQVCVYCHGNEYLLDFDRGRVSATCAGCKTVYEVIPEFMQVLSRP